MDLKLLLLLGLMLCVNFNQNAAWSGWYSNMRSQISIAQDKADAIEKWTHVGVKAGELGDKKELSTAIALVDTLGKAIPCAGPLAALVSGIMGFFVGGGPSELSVVLDKLKEMNNKLDRLDHQIDEVMNKIEEVHITGVFKSRVAGMHKLKHEYERFIRNHNQVTRDDFRRECQANQMLDFAHWINREMNTETQLPLRGLMLRNYDMRNFNEWSNRITAVLSNAMFLHITCVGISPYNASVIEQTLNGRNHNGGDIHTFQQVLASVRNSFYKGMKHIKSRFFGHAKNEIGQFMIEHVNSWPHSGFVEHLYKMLSTKYYWRTWYMASWNGNTYGFDKHATSANDKNVWYWLNRDRRCLIVGSVLSDYNQDLHQQIGYCRWTVPKYTFNMAESIYYYMNRCIHSPQLGGLAVVRNGNGLAGYGGGLFYRNDNYFGGGFSVIAIPSDYSATIPGGEVCSVNGGSCAHQNHCCDDIRYCCSD